MSSLTQCHESPTSNSGRTSVWLARGMDALNRVWSFLERAAAGRRARRQLASADDRKLKDIGLDRSDLRNAAAEPLYRDPTTLLAGRVGEGRTHQPHRLNSGRDRPVRYY
jgi:uncharacterized protein YjiS (DUF1127 family)